ncbi:DUF4942 domain-containing protein [Alteromonas oceanisediminis]|uniref:DUF4942 domain-containing protein n=1 Tax=Alteromonas oceanisediminis TaxID=2836180 RepID=UPI001BD93752|nr:DUF4942 domain-containing protein [Alteromonas oceanisediminis]MBT0587976.1 DUF4942 domain-containing protein [Alteromonas oceanisediminis]
MEQSNLFEQPSAQLAKVKQASVSATVKALKAANEDYEWYPTTAAQIQVITDDVKRLSMVYELEGRDKNPTVLDIGAGCGRVVTAIRDTLNANKDKIGASVKAYAIEKAGIHTSTYRGKNIHLIGTEFAETNLITKSVTFGFCNPPYREFEAWIARLLQELAFKVLYAVIPERWTESKLIKQAIKSRGIEFSEIITTSDFLDAERKARAKVHLVRFSFVDLSQEALEEEKDAAGERWEQRRYHYRPDLGIKATSPFLKFISEELGLHKTTSETTDKFHEYVERQRVKAEMKKEGTESFELVKSRGVIWALLESYERNMQHTLNQYKTIGKLDGNLLSELGIKYEDLLESVRAKLYGWRGVFWGLLFDELDAIKEKLTAENKKTLLNQLSATALDFTYKNCVYVIQYAVEMGNELIEESLIDIYKSLTNADSIKTYYKSNTRVFDDSWRYNRYHGDGESLDRQSKRMLDYRFVISTWGNFGHNSWDHGLNESARQFTDDLIVAFRLLGYGNLYGSCRYEHIGYGDAYYITGTTPDGESVELVKIRFYKNGNRHLSFNQAAMLRLNTAVSRILGWVRSKEEFAEETGEDAPADEVWNISESMKILPSSMLKLTQAA